jgi:hypothetical protein
MKTKSGIKGWVAKLHKVYGNYDEFESYCGTYGIHTRLGFRSPKTCWKKNPTIQGSVIPSDLRVVKV